MICSWYASYPLTINSTDDFIFNHVSILYWFSLPLLLASMFMIAVTSENNLLRWIMTVGIVITMYSASYFYYSLPTSDAHFYRGLNEYFISTKSLDSSLQGKSYFQWPAIFILSDIATSLSGLQFASFTFLAYAILGFTLATTLYVLFSQTYKRYSFIAVIGFFIAMFYYFNYQFAAFTIASILLLLMFILDKGKWTYSRTLIMLLLFVGTAITHAYVSVFFIIYLAIRSVVKRSKQYAALVLATFIIYLIYQITFAYGAIITNILLVFRRSSEIPLFANVIHVSVTFDKIAQVFVWAILATTVAICVIGFVALLFRREMKELGKTLAIFLTGAAYAVVGMVIYILGSRAIPLVFVPISLGAAYLFKSRAKPYAKSIFLILLILFTFIPVHVAYSREFVFFQTEESYKAENFFVDHYGWTKHSSIVADKWVTDYLQGKVIGNASFNNPEEIKEVNAIFYTIGLGLTMSSFNYTIERAISEERLNVVYDNGYSIVASK